jgi:hypothetical protein
MFIELKDMLNGISPLKNKVHNIFSIYNGLVTDLLSSISVYLGISSEGDHKYTFHTNLKRQKHCSYSQARARCLVVVGKSAFRRAPIK